jgi:hypothetical protein
MKKIVVFMLMLVSSLSCASFKSVKTAEEKQALKVFDEYTKAFNNRDMAKMITYFSDDFAWISIKPKVFETLVRGKAQLIESFDKYFKTYPDVRTKIIQLHYDVGFIWTRERVDWTLGKDKYSELINAVYFMKEGKIQRLWYFEPPDALENEE